MKQILAIGAVLTGLTTATAAQDIAAYNTTGSAAMRGNLDRCGAEALENAKLEAMRWAIADVTGKAAQDDRDAAVLNDPDLYIIAGGARRTRDLGNGFCRVSAGFRVDLAGIETALGRGQQTGEAIAALVRFRINGKYVGDRGINPTMATEALNAELQRLGCQSIDVYVFQDTFGPRLGPVNGQILGDDGPFKQQQSFESYARAAQNLVLDIRRSLLDSHASSHRAGSFNKVAIGDVNVQTLGKDPLYSGKVAQAEAQVRIAFVDSRNTLSARPDTIKAVEDNDSAAIRQAVQAAMAALARALDEQHRLCSG